MADIFEEVDEELKEENFKKLWDRYGRYLIAVVILLVGGVAGFKIWENYTTNQRHAFSEQFLAAIDLEEEGKPAEAAAALSVLAAEAGAGQAMLARFREAAVRRAEGDAAAAADIYDTLATSDAIGPLYRDLAALLSVMSQADTGDPAALAARLEPLAADGPWRHTAREYIGMFALRRGDVAAARERFETVADDPEAPNGARQRAAELLQTLGDRR